MSAKSTAEAMRDEAELSHAQAVRKRMQKVVLNGHPEKPTSDAGISTFEKVLGEMLALHKSKGADYGTDEDEYANVRASERFGVPAWLGSVIRANDKMSRLATFALKGKLKNESIEDSLRDLANYAVISLVLWRESCGPFVGEDLPGEDEDEEEIASTET